MSPRPRVRHNRIIVRLVTIFERYLEDKSCTVLVDTDVILAEKERYVPDMMVVCDPKKIRTNDICGAPDLVVEVLSPSTAKRDKTHKKDVYAKCGVREYWLVSPIECAVEQYVLEDGDLRLQEVYTFYPEYELEEMSEEDRAEVVTHFKCTVFDGLDIRLSDIFRI